MIPEAVPEMDSARYFFSILVFLIIILEMAKYFFNLAVAPIRLTRLMKESCQFI
jgi:hypothetical protein